MVSLLHAFGHFQVSSNSSDSQFSAANASRLFKSTMTDSNYFRPYEWGLSDTLTTNHVWDSFVTLSLLDDAVSRGHLLNNPHSGFQSNRLRKWKNALGGEYSMDGPTQFVMHMIFVCESFSCQMELFVRDYLFYSVELSPSNLKLGKCQAIVGDGLNICP